MTPAPAEWGLFVGGLLPAPERDFRDPGSGAARLQPLSMDFGLRFAAIAGGVMGAEGEGSLGSTSTDDDLGATLWGVRGQALVLVPLRRVSPFLLGGGGALGVFSASLGDDAAAALHFGGGAKVWIRQQLALRLDVRDYLTRRQGAAWSAPIHHLEVLVGLALRWLRTRPVLPMVAALDRDRDGILEPTDQCPEVAGLAPRGCPAPDADGDGFADVDDRCPAAGGGAPYGCMARDSDGDGLFDDSDECPEVVGVPRDGCPTPDMTQVLVGALFDGVRTVRFVDEQDVIEEASMPAIDAAAQALLAHPTLRCSIAVRSTCGGDASVEPSLSKLRAMALKEQFVQRGVEPDRLESRVVADQAPPASAQSGAVLGACSGAVEFSCSP